MGRRRKVAIQLALLTKDGMRVASRRGGKRRGAGRKRVGQRARVPHTRRFAFRRNTPLHVTIRVEPSVCRLRQPEIYAALRRSTAVAARYRSIRIVHLSIQHDHLHMLVEADSHVALSKGMQSFLTSAAKQINRALSVDGVRRKGRVFTDRYHAEVINNRRQAHRALGYVLNNWRKHLEDRSCWSRKCWIDPYSSASSFDGWLEDESIPAWPKTYVPLVTRAPTTWLLETGWKLYGPISCFDVPGSGVRNARKKC